MPGLLAAALPSLIQAGTGLLSGFLGGQEKAKERKETFEDWKKQRSTRFGDLNKITSGRYRTAQDLFSIDPMIKKLLIGRMSSYIPQSNASQWGIDFNKILGNIGSRPTAGSPAASFQPFAGGGMSGKRTLDDGNLANNILNKYSANMG